jgi:hypothetical protein
MADRTSAGLFGNIFEYIVGHTEMDVEDFIKWLWKQQENYDFSPYQMGCDDALLELGLAKYIKKDDFDIIIFKGDERWDEQNT